MANAFILFGILGIFGSGLIIVAMALLLVKEGAKEQKLMLTFLCGALIQNVGYLFELTAPTLEAAVVAVKMQYLGSIFVPLCYCWFMYAYCYEKAPVLLVRILAAIDLGTLLLVLSFDRHNLYYKNFEWVESGGHYHLNLSYGIVYYIFLAFGCAIPYFMSFLVLVKTIIKKPDLAAGRKCKRMMVLSALPFLALLLYIGKLTYMYDPTPSVLGIVLSLVAITVWRSRTYDFRYLAAGAVLNSISDGIIALDLQKRIVNYNQAAADIFAELGVQRLGGSIEDITEFPQSMIEHMNNQLFNLNDHIYEGHVKDIVDEYGKRQGWVALVIDVTDTRNYIEEIKRVSEQAERANAAKSEFLANMSHEIRTPMNAIVGLSDIIMEESQGRKLYFYANDIKSASQNLLTIINDILDLSKVEAGRMELVLSEYYVKTVVDEIINMMDIAASQRGLLMKYEYDMTIPCRYYGDEGRIKQILINILNNAVKFTKEGYVKIFVGGRPGNAEDEELLVFRVEDTGCGIRKEDQEKIFEEFRQVDSKRNRSAEGTGLGLAITKQLVQLMEGWIELESVYGEGATFTVTIPQKIIDRRPLSEVPDISGNEGEKEKVKSFVARGYKVLVVDDNLINRKVAKGLMNSYQFDLMEAESGFEAIQLVRENKYDLIFMDHMMPQMDGIETVRKIRQECGENGTSPTIIALTANAMEGVRERFLSNGFQDFIPKPLDKGQLNEILVKWVPDELREEPDLEQEQQEQEAAGKQEELWNIRIKGIDLDAVRRIQTGSLEDYKELLQLYCIDGKRKLKHLRKLYEEKNYKNYEIEVHGLKSASANIGAMKLSNLAKKHEEAMIEKDWEFVSSNFSYLISFYEEQLAGIQAFLNQGEDSDPETKDGLAEIDQEAFLKEVKEALAQLESFHSKECARIVDGLLKYRLGNYGAGLREIRQQLALYEDDRAEQLFHELIKQIEEES